MTLLEKIDKMLKDTHKNRRIFSEESGIPYTTISNWYQRGYDNLTLPTFRCICNYFNVTMDSMAYDNREIEYKTDISPATISGEKQELLNKYDQLDIRGQASVHDTINQQLKYMEKGETTTSMNSERSEDEAASA